MLFFACTPYSIGYPYSVHSALFFFFFHHFYDTEIKILQARHRKVHSQENESRSYGDWPFIETAVRGGSANNRHQSQTRQVMDFLRDANLHRDSYIQQSDPCGPWAEQPAKLLAGFNPQ